MSTYALNGYGNPIAPLTHGRARTFTPTPEDRTMARKNRAAAYLRGGAVRADQEQLLPRGPSCVTKLYIPKEVQLLSLDPSSFAELEDSRQVLHNLLGGKAQTTQGPEGMGPSGKGLEIAIIRYIAGDANGRRLTPEDLVCELVPDMVKGYLTDKIVSSIPTMNAVPRENLYEQFGVTTPSKAPSKADGNRTRGKELSSVTVDEDEDIVSPNLLTAVKGGVDRIDSPAFTTQFAADSDFHLSCKDLLVSLAALYLKDDRAVTRQDLETRNVKELHELVVTVVVSELSHIAYTYHCKGGIIPAEQRNEIADEIALFTKSEMFVHARLNQVFECLDIEGTRIIGTVFRNAKSDMIRTAQRRSRMHGGSLLAGPLAISLGLDCKYQGFFARVAESCAGKITSTSVKAEIAEINRMRRSKNETLLAFMYRIHEKFSEIENKEQALPEGQRPYATQLRCRITIPVDTYLDLFEKHPEGSKVTSESTLIQVHVTQTRIRLNQLRTTAGFQGEENVYTLLYEEEQEAKRLAEELDTLILNNRDRFEQEKAAAAPAAPAGRQAAPRHRAYLFTGTGCAYCGDSDHTTQCCGTKFYDYSHNQRGRNAQQSYIDHMKQNKRYMTPKGPDTMDMPDSEPRIVDEQDLQDLIKSHRRSGRSAGNGTQRRNNGSQGGGSQGSAKPDEGVKELIAKMEQMSTDFESKLNDMAERTEQTHTETQQALNELEMATEVDYGDEESANEE